MKKTFTFILMAIGFTGFAQAPTSSATTPSQMASDVVSVYSDAYTSQSGTNFYPNWGQTTTYDTLIIGSDSIIEYGTLNYQGVEMSPSLDLSAKGMLHIDMFTNDVSSIEIFLINPGPVERKVTETLTSGAWTSIDIDLADYTSQGMSMSDVFQFKFVDPNGSAGTVWMDNIYFYGSPSATEPATAAATPDHNDTNVISVYSGAYMDVAGTDFYPNWGQSTTFDWFDVSGDSSIKYGNLNYQGIAMTGSIDASNMEYLHLDVWSSSADSFNLFMINPGPVEHKVTPQLTSAEWTSIDIPLADYSGQGIDLSDIFQFKIDGANNGTLFIDNIYFYKVPPIPTPMMAAMHPTNNDTDVISLFCDTFTNVTVDTWRTSWSNATLEDEMIGTNNIKKYSMLDFVGIETVGTNSLDVSGMDDINFDAWSPNATLYRIKIVDFGTDNSFGGGDDTEHELAFDMPATQTWTNHSISLDSFTGLTGKENISQIIFSAQPTGEAILYIDNLFFSRKPFVATKHVKFEEFNVYPNPTSGTLNIRLRTNNVEIESVELTDIQGKSLIVKNVNSTKFNTPI